MKFKKRAKLSGRGRTTIYRDVEEGRLSKPFKLGGTLFWRDSEVDDRIAELSSGVEESK